MVFSQTSHKTQSVLKVVEIDRLKPEKSQQVNGSTGVATDGSTGTMPTTPVPTTSFSEGYLKQEPLFEDTMLHDTNCEFFQDLVQWCSAPAKEEQTQTIDPPEKTEDRACNSDTLHTPFSPHGWDAFNINSPYQTGFYNTTPVDPPSPNIEELTQFNHFFIDQDPNKVMVSEKFLDISKLPVVMGDLSSGTVPDNSWVATKPIEVTNTYDTNYNKMYTYNTFPFIDQDDSFDTKFVTVTPQEVESNNNILISEYINHDDLTTNEEGLQELGVQGRSSGLSVDVGARPPAWATDAISTPEVLNYVEQLEKSHTTLKATPWSVQEPGPDLDSSCSKVNLSSPVEYEPITPKSESHLESENDDIKPHSKKRRHDDSEDSDETYTPYTEQTNRKYKRRKPSVPIKDMILALEGSQQLTKARRGRPPKRRESTVSSVCSVDDNSSSISTHENKYRELRDKNNEASKRSRMNRKLKELQMEQLAEELEEKNKKLMVKAEILEEMTKKLKDALMTAILQK